jgi:diguanylate cyclase (GGDEF)-like protein
MRLVMTEDLRIQRYHRAATIVLFELDGLDRLVERLGPGAAERVVPALADTIRRLARKPDRVARLAPGRFAVLLSETDEVAAINYVERVRRACELWLESGAIALRLAAGWAGTTGDPTLPDAMRIATERMYVELRRHARRAPEATADR